MAEAKVMPLAERIRIRRNRRLPAAMDALKVMSSTSSSTSSAGRAPVMRPPSIRARRALSSSSSSISSGISTPIRGVLQIDQVASGPMDNVAGSTAVTLLMFDATVANENVVLSTLKFRAEQGSLSAADQYELHAVSSTGQRTRLSVAPFSSDVIAFHDQRILLQEGKTQRFAITARLRSGGSSSSIALGFLTSDPLFIQAKGIRYNRDLAPGIQVDDIPCNGAYVCRVIVHTRPAGNITVHTLGNLFVTRDTLPSPSRQLLLGEKSDAALRLKFHATAEDVAVTYLSIGGGNDSIFALELFTDGSSTPFATAREVQCDTPTPGEFCARMADGMFTVPQDRDVRVHARAVMKANREGGTSGETAAFTLTDSTSSHLAVKARGHSSGKDLSQNNGNSSTEGEIFIGRESPGGNSSITSSTHDAVAAKITGISNANADADQSAIPYGLSTFGAFRFTAAPNQNARFVTFTRLVFTVSALNFQVADIRLFNTADSSKTITCSTSGTTGTITVTCDNPVNGTVVTSIDQGSTATFALRGFITSGNIGGTAFLQATLGSLGDRSTPGSVEWTDGESSFTWMDVPVTQVRSTQYRS